MPLPNPEQERANSVTVHLFLDGFIGFWLVSELIPKIPLDYKVFYGLASHVWSALWLLIMKLLQLFDQKNPLHVPKSNIIQTRVPDM